MAFHEMTREEFIALMIKRGWTKEDAEAEWNAIQNDDESGYDGP